MSKVYVSIGSNIDRAKNISASLDALHTRFGDLTISSVFESEAVGFDGDPFYNLVVGFTTELSVGELFENLRDVEFENGRCRSGAKFSSRTLDIDILTYDDRAGKVDGIELPRAEIDYNAFVLWPLAEIAGLDTHPVTNISYADMWSAFDKSCQKLWSVGFIWRGETI
jgi:2-amino-4-hydroxy-6-hydroxymethyldihydropteridine diphosphokinase